MDGILNILKPPGMTSHDVVAYIRRLTGIKKVGHTGTLDPSAVGVLPICTGKATKASEYIIGGSKKYRAEIKLGIITDTADKEGNVITINSWRNYIDINNFEEKIKEVLKSFLGKNYQTPPMFSAVKLQGKKLYELAREGKEVDRKPREIYIYGINLFDFSLEQGTILFDVICSKGTYIRVLCEDIGKKIGCGAHMSYLIRLEASTLKIENSFTLEQIKELCDKKQLNTALIPLKTYFQQLPKYVIRNLDDQKRFLNGVKIALDKKEIKFASDNRTIAIYFDNEQFIGLAKILDDTNSIITIKVEKFFV